MSLKTAKALENVGSYRYNLSSDLSMLNEDVQIMRLEGEVDSIRNRMHLSMRSTDRSIEAIIIVDKVYVRESNSSWQVQELRELEIWKDKLSDQTSILYNAENLTMYKENDEWILEIIPEKEEVTEQMRKMGLETSGSELKSFAIRYWIEDDTFYIKKTETDMDIQMNVMGLNTQVKLTNVIHLFDYDEKMKIEAPI